MLGHLPSRHFSPPLESVWHPLAIRRIQQSDAKQTDRLKVLARAPQRAQIPALSGQRHRRSQASVQGIRTLRMPTRN